MSGTGSWNYYGDLRLRMLRHRAQLKALLISEPTPLSSVAVSISGKEALHVGEQMWGLGVFMSREEEEAKVALSAETYPEVHELEALRIHEQ